MSVWRNLIDCEDWSGLDNYWPCARREVCVKILTALQGLVPVVERGNGTERRFERALPDEVSENLSGAAKILLLGELEARAMGDGFLSGSLARWNEIYPQIRKSCAELAELPEVTDGATDMSRAQHATEATRLLAHIPPILDAMLYPGDKEKGEAPDYELGRALQEHVAEVALRAFDAGRHIQLALGKEHESDAVWAKNIRETARKNGEKGGQADKKRERYSMLNAWPNRTCPNFSLPVTGRRFAQPEVLPVSMTEGPQSRCFNRVTSLYLTNGSANGWLHFAKACMQDVDNVG